MDIKTKETYSEVYGVLELLGEYYIRRLPSKMYNMIEEERLKEYNPSYSMPIKNENIKKEALAIIAVLHLNYWCETEEEKRRLNNFFENNYTKYQDELRNMYIVNNNEKETETENDREEKEQKIEKEINKKEDNIIGNSSVENNDETNIITNSNNTNNNTDIKEYDDNNVTVFLKKLINKIKGFFKKR